MFNWASAIVDEESANVLLDQKVNVNALLRISQEALERWGMKGGPATEIIAAMKKPDPSESKKVKNPTSF